MEIDKLTSAMKASISEVLETMFFLPVELLATAQGTCRSVTDKAVIVAKLHFDGPATGFFRLTIPESLACQASADFLGVGQAELTEADVGGTILEMINMLVGNTFSIYDADAVFDLSVPEMEPSDAGQVQSAVGSNTVHVDIDTLDNRMILELSLSI